MAIDDPMPAIRELIPDADVDFIDAALQASSIKYPWLLLGSVVKSVFSKVERDQRVTATLVALCDELERIQDRLPHDLQSAFDSIWFKRAIRVLVDEGAKEINDDRAKLLARVTAQGCFPVEESKHRQDDLANYIHDLARLGEEDILMLKLLGVSYREALTKTPNLHDPNYFSMHYEGFSRRADEMKIHNDDRLSSGARLSGFGLAIQSPIPHTSTGSSQEFYRPSKRGFYLLSLMEAAELPTEKQN